MNHLKIVIDKNKIIIQNFKLILKIDYSEIWIDEIKIFGQMLKIDEIDEGEIRLNGVIQKIEFINVNHQKD